MLFSSVIFLFYFLPIVLTFYFLPSRSWRNGFFLVASLVFYTFTEGGFVLVLLGSIAGNYLFGLWLEYARSRRSSPNGKKDACPRGRDLLASGRFALACGICFNLGLLAVFKYANFVIANINTVLREGGLPIVSLGSLYAPVGISFFTFHAISYLVDISRNDSPVLKNPFSLAVYLSAFPKILAGPITLYRNAYAQLASRIVTGETFLYGIERFITGLAKKILIANPLSDVADAAFGVPGANMDMPNAWAGIICYTLQIYFDFSGYSDMAIGLGKMFGFTFPENFNYPYISTSVREFWQRWHISLSTWFREYLYIPLGGNRCAPSRVYFNLVVVFVLCGLWHGASWNFVVWGLWYGLFLSVERTKFGKLLQSAWRPLRHVYLLVVVITGWVFFRAENLSHAFAYLGAMFGLRGVEESAQHFALVYDNELFALLPIAVVLCVPLSVYVRRFCLPSGRAPVERRGGLPRYAPAAYALLLCLFFVLSCMSLAGDTHKAFIYFKF